MDSKKKNGPKSGNDVASAERDLTRTEKRLRQRYAVCVVREEGKEKFGCRTLSRAADAVGEARRLLSGGPGDAVGDGELGSNGPEEPLKSAAEFSPERTAGESGGEQGTPEEERD